MSNSSAGASQGKRSGSGCSMPARRRDSTFSLFHTASWAAMRMGMRSVRNGFTRKTSSPGERVPADASRDVLEGTARPSLSGTASFDMRHDLREVALVLLGGGQELRDLEADLRKIAG